MAKEKFERLHYVGPLSSFSVLTVDPKKNAKATLAAGEFHAESADRALVTGTTYDDLPMDHPVIKNLIAAKLLIAPPADDPPAASPKTTVPDSTNTQSGDDRSTSAPAQAAVQEGNAK